MWCQPAPLASIRGQENDDRQRLVGQHMWRGVMFNFFSLSLAFSLIISAIGGANAQSAGQGRAPVSTTGAVKPNVAPNATSPATTDELMAMLPASDLIAVVSAGRAFNELLPKLGGFTAGGLDKLATSIQDFIR